MPATPKEQARREIDRLLGAAGWSVQDFKCANLRAVRAITLLRRAQSARPALYAAPPNFI